MKKILLVIIMIAASLPVWAEEKAISLDEIVVTATRADEEIDKISSNITVITQEEIKKSTAITVQDLLKAEEGLIVRDLYGTGTKSTVDMRGFAKGVNTVVLIDGRRINQIDSGAVDWNLIPLENVERIEIVRGSESVLYGDNALAGAINIITKKGFTKKPELVLDARAESYSGHSEYGTFTGGNDWIGYFFFIKHRQTEGYRENSNFNATDINTRLNFKINSTFSIDAAAGYHEDEQGLPGALFEREVKDDRRQSREPKNNAHYDHRYVDIKGNILLGAWGDLELGYSYDNTKFGAQYLNYFTNMDRDSSTIGLRAKLTVDTKISSFRNLTIAGVDYFDSTVDNASKDTFGTWSSAAEITKEETGLYLQNEFFINERLSISAGYRYSSTQYGDTVSNLSLWGNSTGSDNVRFTEDSFRLGINYNYQKGSKVFLSYAKGYRLPATDELVDYLGNVKLLKPEKSDTYEIGIVHSFGDRLQIRLTAYTMDVRDELYVNPQLSFGFGDNQNLDKTKHYGAEAGFSAKITDTISAFGSFTYSVAKFDAGPYDENYIPMVPRYTASIGADFRPMKELLLSMKGTWVDQRYLENDVKNDLDQLESSFVLDTKISYTYKNITAYLGINNLLNEEFSDYGAHSSSSNYEKYYPAPERNFYGGLRIAL